MNYNIDFKDNRVIVSFSDTLQELEISKAFLEVVDTIDIKKVKHLIFDCSKVIEYEIPNDYLTRVKVLTLFSTSWNADVNAIFIAKNENLRKMATAYINHDEDLKWTYLLFETLEETLKWCEKNN